MLNLIHPISNTTCGIYRQLIFLAIFLKKKRIIDEPRIFHKGKLFFIIVMEIHTIDYFLIFPKQVEFIANTFIWSILQNDEIQTNIA
ncbi:hypothetical protein B0T37_10445 [Chromobacterium violaceum]|nr:hypothetical protein B0T38_10840 [Chromobacterium violaceum]OQS26475.1 hypothetical protein B0T37_10445 [Chromobacterium violaceum]